MNSNQKNYFCGWNAIDENVIGGTGETIEDAIADYIGNHLDDELNDVFDPSDTEVEIEVLIYNVISPEASKEQWGEGVVDDNWEWCIDRLMEKRKLKFKYRSSGMWDEIRKR